MIARGYKRVNDEHPDMVKAFSLLTRPPPPSPSLPTRRHRWFSAAPRSEVREKQNVNLLFTVNGSDTIGTNLEIKMGKRGEKIWGSVAVVYIFCGVLYSTVQYSGRVDG
jgi:hypothetical protein